MSVTTIMDLVCLAVVVLGILLLLAVLIMWLADS